MSDAVLAETADASHDGDLYLWSRRQAGLLEEGRFDELDLANLVDEVRALGASEKREIRNRLAVLLAHLLKWRHQPGRRSSSRETTIVEQRRELAEVLAENPSLRRYPARVLATAFGSARLQAAKETGLDLTLFPDVPSFTAEQALDRDFLPRSDGEQPLPIASRSPD